MFARFTLIALAVVWSAAPAAAGTIVGSFYFERDSFLCELLGEPTCVPFERFVLDNSAADAGADFADLMFSAVIQIGGGNYDFDDPSPISSGDSAETNALAPLPFTDASEVSLVFNIENLGLYPGTLRLSPFIFDDDVSSPLIFSADVVFTANAVTEAPSWLVVVIGISALALGRLFLA